MPGPDQSSAGACIPKPRSSCREAIFVVPLKVRKRHAHQPDTFCRGKHRAHKAEADVAQGFLRGHDCRQGSAARGLAEIAVFDLHRYGPPEGLRLLAPGPDLICHRLHASLDLGRMSEVVGEGRFRSRGLAWAVRHDRTVVLAIADGVKPRTRLTEVLLQEGQRLSPQIGACEDAEPVHLVGSHRPHAVEFADWQRGDERQPPSPG